MYRIAPCVGDCRSKSGSGIIGRGRLDIVGAVPDLRLGHIAVGIVSIGRYYALGSGGREHIVMRVVGIGRGIAPRILRARQVVVTVVLEIVLLRYEGGVLL